jgi:hypothetical protein
MMRASWLALSLFAMSSLLGCTRDGAGNSTGDSTGTDGSGGDAFCVHQCMSDTDCWQMGYEVGLSCVDSLCTPDTPYPPLCTDDQGCIAWHSVWTTACTAGGGECEPFGRVCLDIGFCGILPSVTPCAELWMEELQTTDIDGNPVVVCWEPDATCLDDGLCFVPCESDGECLDNPSHSTCNLETGICQCGSDADCAINQPPRSVCNAGTCGCGEDQHCIDGNIGDVCMSNGQCGCSNDMACDGISNYFDGGALVCRAP